MRVHLARLHAVAWQIRRRRSFSGSWLRAAVQLANDAGLREAGERRPGRRLRNSSSRVDMRLADRATSSAYIRRGNKPLTQASFDVPIELSETCRLFMHLIWRATPDEDERYIYAVALVS